MLKVERVLFCIATLSLLSCSTQQQESQTKNIYEVDEGDALSGSERRRPATTSEKSTLVNFSGCTANYIAKNYVLTASHCLTSVNRVPAGLYQGNRIEFEKVIERNETLDYAILKAPPSEDHLTSIVTSESQISVSTALNSGIEMFTVGYPADKQEWNGTYAKGRGKEIDQHLLKYNVGIINGNSGGVVQSLDSGTIVAMTNGGTHNFEQPGWDKSDHLDPASWNHGTGGWAIYAASDFFRSVFPNGVYDLAAEEAFLAVGGGDAVIEERVEWSFSVFFDQDDASLQISDEDDDAVSCRQLGWRGAVLTYDGNPLKIEMLKVYNRVGCPGEFTFVEIPLASLTTTTVNGCQARVAKGAAGDETYEIIRYQTGRCSQGTYDEMKVGGPANEVSTLLGRSTRFPFEP